MVVGRWWRVVGFDVHDHVADLDTGTDNSLLNLMAEVVSGHDR